MRPQLETYSRDSAVVETAISAAGSTSKPVRSFRLQVSSVLQCWCQQWTRQAEAELEIAEEETESDDEFGSAVIKVIPDYLQSIILSYFSYADILLAYTHSLRLLDLVSNNTVGSVGLDKVNHLKPSERVIQYPESGIHQRFSLLSTSTANHKKMEKTAIGTGIKTLKDCLYFFGGYDKANSCAVSDTRMYSMSDGEWKTLSPMKHERYESRALLMSDHSRSMESLLGKDMVEYAVVVGGYSTYAVPYCELYDLSNDQWYDLPNTPLQIAEFAAGSSGYRVFVAGGTDSHSVLNECLMLDVFDLIYDLPDESERIEHAMKTASLSSAGDLSAMSDADIVGGRGLSSLLRAKSVKSVDRIVEEYRCRNTTICGDYLLPSTDATGQGSGTEKLTVIRNPNNPEVRPVIPTTDESDEDMDIEVDPDLDTHVDPTSKHRLWQKLPSLNRHRYGLAGLVTQGSSRLTPNRFYVFGGHRAYRSCECLDLVQGSHFERLPKCRYDHSVPTMYESQNGCLVVTGDYLKVNQLEVFDPRMNAWISDVGLHVTPDFQPESKKLRTFYPI